MTMLIPRHYVLVDYLIDGNRNPSAPDCSDAGKLFDRLL
jgi:hypothetical protein